MFSSFLFLKTIIKDTNEQSDKEVHKVRSRRTPGPEKVTVHVDAFSNSEAHLTVQEAI